MNNLTDADRADLKAAKDTFFNMMSKLTPDQQLARAEVLAAGMRETDPLTRALAQQVVDGHKLRSSIEAHHRELDDLDGVNLNEYRPKEPDFKGRVLSRRHAVEQLIARDMVEVVKLSEDKLEGPQRKAAEYFRELRQRNSRQAAIAEAIARKQAERDQAEIDSIADGIVNGSRYQFGKRDSAGHSM
jgi:hypothetical protein